MMNLFASLQNPITALLTALGVLTGFYVFRWSRL